MKRIAFVSRNRLMIERITASLNTRLDLDFQLLSTSRYEQAELDIELFGAEVVVLDATDNETMTCALGLCEKLCNEKYTNSPCLFLIKQCAADEERAIQAQKDGLIRDYVIYDDSLDLLFAKLSAM